MREQRLPPESSIESARPTEKFRGNKNRLLAKAPLALTMKNQGRWSITPVSQQPVTQQVVLRIFRDVTIPSVR
jgi:hypothetical protein